MKPHRSRSVSLVARRSRSVAVNLQPVVQAVLRRAEEQGHIHPREIREELAKADVDSRQWPQVVRQAGNSLERCGGHYRFVPPASPVRVRQFQTQERIHAVVHELVGQYRQAAAQHERREADRITFLQPVTLHLPDDKVHQVVTKDISTSGIRLLGSRDLLGQKVRVTMPRPKGLPCVFLVRIVWTCRVGDDLYENGGVFLASE